MVEERREVGIVRGIVDDEAGIDRDRALGAIDIDRVGVPAEPAVLLVERHVVAAAQQPSRREPGDAGADNRNAAP